MCGTDILANNLHISFERLIEILQWGPIVFPLIGFAIAFRACVALQRTDAHPIKRPVGSVILRTADGAYHSAGEYHGNGHGEDNGHADHNGHADISGNGHAADATPAVASEAPVSDT